MLLSLSLLSHHHHCHCCHHHCIWLIVRLLHMLLPCICCCHHLCPLPPPPPNAVVLSFFVALPLPTPQSSHCHLSCWTSPVLAGCCIANMSAINNTTQHMTCKKTSKVAILATCWPCQANTLGQHEDMSSKLTYWWHPKCQHFQLNSQYIWVFLTKTKEPPLDIIDTFLDRCGHEHGGSISTD